MNDVLQIMLFILIFGVIFHYSIPKNLKRLFDCIMKLFLRIVYFSITILMKF